MSENVLIDAIQGAYPKFPEDFRPLVDAFTLEYPQQEWFGNQMLSGDLSDLFKKAIEDARTFGLTNGIALTDDQLFDVFNLAVMRMSVFAHSESPRLS